MSIVFCPRCHQRILIAKGVIDYIHECNSGTEVLDNEDIKLIGQWTDFTGSDFTNGAVTGFLRGIDNKLQGTRAQAEFNERTHDYTSRGKIKSTHRTRQHLEFIDINEHKNNSVNI